MRGEKENATYSGKRNHAEQHRIHSGNEHHDKCGRTEQDGRSEVHLGENKREQQSDDRERKNKAAEQTTGCLFITRKPSGEKKHRSDLRNLRGLKTELTEANPPARTVNAHSEMRNEAKRQRNECETKPKPPCPLPKMVIDERSDRADGQPDSEPNRLASDEEVNIAMTVARKGARAEKHDDADDEHAEHGQKQDVSAFTMH